MKRSEANEILKKRIEFSTKYDCFSVKEVVGEASESYFSHGGCECCQGPPGDVYDVTHLAVKDTKNKVFDNIFESQLCGGCLCSLVNGDDTDLDYHVDDEDCLPFDPNKIVTSSGILTNLEKPRVGVIGVNDELLIEYIHDLLDPNDMIDLTYEEYIKDLNDQGMSEDEIELESENYESDNTTYLLGDWVKIDGKYTPDKTKDYAATYNIDSNTICVEWSKTTRKVHYTSPCYVMANGSGPCGDLSQEGEVLAYDLPSEFYHG